MKKHEAHRNFDGDLSKVPEIRNWVIEQLIDSRIAESVIGDIKIALSEALTNIYRHSYSNEIVKPVRIKVFINEDKIQITLRDFGKRFDLSNYKSPDMSQLSSNGFGIYMIHKLMDGVQYIPKEVGTELIMWKHIHE